jgi:hypothetical protein
MINFGMLKYFFIAQILVGFVASIVCPDIPVVERILLLWLAGICGVVEWHYRNE